MRQPGMRREWHPVRLLVTVAVVLLFASCTSSGVGGAAAASCVGPYLNALPPGAGFREPIRTVGPGDTLTVYGHWYTSTCNDTGGHDRLIPLPAVQLTLILPGGAVEDLGRFTAGGKDMGFSTVVHVPEGTAAGTAWIRDNQQHPATYKFRVGD